jgi:hypothetical protein
MLVAAIDLIKYANHWASQGHCLLFSSNLLPFAHMSARTSQFELYVCMQSNSSDSRHICHVYSRAEAATYWYARNLRLLLVVFYLFIYFA